MGIYDLLKAAQLEQNKTIVTVTHDINLAGQYCDKILLLGTDGSCYTGDSQVMLSSDRIRKVFDVDILEGKIGRQSFFIPLGKLAIDRDNIDGNQS